MNEGMLGLIGQNVTLFCMNYIYTGTLVSFDGYQAKLENAKIVYETGAFDDPEWRDAQPIPNGVWYVRVSAIESYGVMK